MLGIKNSSSVIFFLLLLQHANTSFSQTEISGTVKSANIPLHSVSVILKDSTSTQILKYTYTNKIGYYSLKFNEFGKFNLVLTSLGFESKTIPLFLSQDQESYKINVNLDEKTLDLEEVIIKTEKAIVVRKDTVVYKTNRFTDGTENTVEDLLQKIPGINIASDGTIKIGNQEIEKIMVDGDDFFERGYKILSKNMPAYPIEEVELLKRFSDNRLLKGIEESNKVALNLKLNEKSKRIWFGNTELSYGNDNYYQLKFNFMNFGKKNKYYFLVNGNNIGYDASGDINQLIRPFRFNEAGSIGDDQSVENLLDISIGDLDFKRSRTNFNNVKLVSFNAIFNPSEKLKIKPIAFFNWDKTDFFMRSLNTVNVNGTNFSNTEDYRLQNNPRYAFGKFDIVYNISANRMLEATTKYNNADFSDGSDLIFNNISTVEGLTHQNKLIDQSINYTSKIKANQALLITSRIINEKSPQIYSLNQFFYQDLFSDVDSANSVSQSSNIVMFYAGFNSHLITRRTNGDLMEIQLGNSYRIDKLNTTFSIFNDESLIVEPQGYQNKTRLEVNDLYLESNYRKKIGKVAVTANLHLHQLFNKLKNAQLSTDQTVFYINPSLDLEWNLNKRNTLYSSYSFNTRNSDFLDVYSEFVLTGFRSFSKGTGRFNQLDASAFSLNYSFNDNGGRFSASAAARYTKNHDFFSNRTIVAQNFTQSEKVLFKDRELFFANSIFDYFFDIISSNLKLKLGYSQFQYRNIVNESGIRDVTSNNLNYSSQLRSGFSGKFNFHIGTEWSYSQIKTRINRSFTDNVSFLDLTFILNKKLDFQIKTERYYFGNLDSDNVYYFLDFESRYKLAKDKLTLGVTGKNLFNIKRFRQSYISDIGNSVVEYRLLPRFILLNLQFRF